MNPTVSRVIGKIVLGVLVAVVSTAIGNNLVPQVPQVSQVPQVPAPTPSLNTMGKLPHILEDAAGELDDIEFPVLATLASNNVRAVQKEQERSRLAVPDSVAERFPNCSRLGILEGATKQPLVPSPTEGDEQWLLYCTGVTLRQARTQRKFFPEDLLDP